METYVEAKGLVDNQDFSKQREIALGELSFNIIDKPIVDVIRKITTISYCFTLQSCYGHFLYDQQNDPNNIEPILSIACDTNIEYRIAYVAVCVENSLDGKRLLKELSELISTDLNCIQYGSAEWFWDRQINSYVIQVEPERFRTQDRCVIDYQEAIRLEKVRNQFYQELDMIIEKHIS